MQLELISNIDDIDSARVVPRSLERELYEPVLASLKRFWIPREEMHDYVIEITANQGSRNTGGLWTRPDLVCVAAMSFPYVPGRNLDLTTFELKKSITEGIAGVYETAAHSAFSHRSFLVLQVPSRLAGKDTDDYLRVLNECKRFGLGLITFSAASDWQTYEIVVIAEFHSPNPAQVNKFIANQISDESRHKILTMFR